MQNKKIAIVYDWIDKWGGVERVLLNLHELFPTADFYTSYYDEKTAPWAKDFKIKTSFIQSLPNFIKKSRILSLPFYPYAFESFDLSEYDVVISVSSSFAKSVITRPDTLHICYLLTPTRYLWVYPEDYLTNPLKRWYAGKLRKWDLIAAQRPDKIISISQTVADRCKRFYNRDSEVIYPPFDEEYWKKMQSKNNKTIQDDKKFFLIVSRLEPYKKVDLAMEVFNKHPEWNLVVVGSGTQKQYLQNKSNRNIEFLETVSDAELSHLYTSAQALIMPQEEDFGYTALEAQFFGCPIIYYHKGGALETIKNDTYNLHFKAQTEQVLSNTLATFHTLSYNDKNIENKRIFLSEKFSKEHFKKEFLNALKSS